MLAALPGWALGLLPGMEEKREREILSPGQQGQGAVRGNLGCCSRIVKCVSNLTFRPGTQQSCKMRVKIELEVGPDEIAAATELLAVLR